MMCYQKPYHALLKHAWSHACNVATKVAKYGNVFRHYNSSLDKKKSRLPANQYANTVMISVARKVFLDKIYLHAASYACSIRIASHNNSKFV